LAGERDVNWLGNDFPAGLGWADSVVDRDYKIGILVIRCFVKTLAREGGAHVASRLLVTQRIVVHGGVFVENLVGNRLLGLGFGERIDFHRRRVGATSSEENRSGSAPERNPSSGAGEVAEI